MGDLSDEELSELERNVEHIPSSPIALGELEPLLTEIGRHRAMVKRLEAWADLLESDTFAAGGIGVGPFIAAELRNRMKEPSHG